MLQFLHHDDNNDAKVIAIPRFSSENSRAENYAYILSEREREREITVET